MKRTFRILSVISIIVVASACDKFLDTMPDNRAEINSQSKIQALLTSAYPSTDYMLLTEFMSDNVDDYGSNNPYTDRFIDQVYAWKDITESDNEDSERLWENSYIAISSANQALLAIEELGGVEATGMYPEMAEALLCRAYNHFILVNVFCMQYNSKTSTSDLGIPYITEPETTLDPKYDRGTVAQTYEMIEKDIKAALPYISDTYYTVPKYHFNAKAAYAFAARFYLYYEKFAKSIEYADKVLGSQPATMLRDWAAQAEMTQQYDAIVEHFISSSLNTNLLLMTAYSKMGLAFGPYSVYSKYAHGEYLANNETGIAITPLWRGSNDTYYSPMKIYAATNLDKTIFWKLPYLFEYADPVAQIGYYRTVYPAFTGDEVLPFIKDAAEKLIVQEEVTQFYVSGYGSFDRLAGRAMSELKAVYPFLQLYRVIPYHPANRKIELPQGFDGTYYPEGLEYVPPMYAISRANQSMIDQCNFLIAYVCHPAGKASKFLEYARKREKKGLVRVICLV